jgi:integrase
LPQVKLNAAFIDKVKPPTSGDRVIFWDEKLPSFGLMVTAAGHKSFVLQYRANGISRRATINGGLKFGAAKEQAQILLGRIAAGADPMAEKRKERDERAGTLRAVVQKYLSDPKVKALRSVNEKTAIFNRHIFPTLGSKAITEIKRSEIVRLLDKITEKSGPGAADVAYKVLARVFSWYAPKDDDFVNPIVKGLHAKTAGDGARGLVDDEVRILWNVASEGRGPYDHLVKFALLTGCRLNEVAQMKRSELSADGSEWTIPSKRYKTKIDHLVPLSRLAQDVLAGVKVINGSDWVFTTDGKKPISGFSNFKKAFDKRLHEARAAEGDAVRDRIIADLNESYPGKGYQPFKERWSTHSLRKTARTLLSKAGVDKEIREKCLGHIEPSIERTYDHHDFKLEKRTAFEALSRLIERIVSGKVGNVVPLHLATKT